MAPSPPEQVHRGHLQGHEGQAKTFHHVSNITKHQKENSKKGCKTSPK
jgi:hypothetical protein